MVEAALNLAERVVAWQGQAGRQHLPWQHSRDPYRVWLSEIMLQQTQVSTVLAYYTRFLQRCPTVADLAAASPDEVMALWAGLGYYSRARNLHACAQRVVHEHGGQFPRTAEGLATLPGIGRSTAAAIAAFCFHERVAILDGNVKRVLGRAWAFDGDLARAAEERRLWALAQAALPTRASDMPAYTQGLMDLGATVCTARKPDCAVCPLAGLCLAHQRGQELSYPVKTRKLKRGARSSVWLWLHCEGQVWLQARPATGIWAGLWTLPLFDDLDQALDALRSWRIDQDLEHLTPIDHALTHLDWRLHPVRVRLPKRPAWSETGQWVDLAHWQGDRAAHAAPPVALPAPLTKLLTKHLSNWS